VKSVYFDVDRFAAAWYAIVAILVLANWGNAGDPLLFFTFFAGAGAIVLALPHVARGFGPRGRVLFRGFYYYLLILATFEMVGHLVPIISPDSRENWLLRADRMLFGSDPTRWFGWSEHFPFVTELLQIIYSSFYFLPLILAWRLLRQRNYAALEHALLLLIAGFLISYLGYLLIPARSPYRLFAYPFELKGVLATPWLRDALYVLEAKRHDAFPSGHSDVTWLVAALAWQYDRKSFYWFFGPISVLLPLGTVYLRYHYGTDVIAGAFFAIGTWRLCSAIERRSAESQDANPPGAEARSVESNPAEPVLQ
jgi:membrane-associated phospholipid phosphatase